MALVMWNCHYRLNICIVTWSCHYSLQDFGNIIISQYLNTMEIECVFCALVFCILEAILMKLASFIGIAYRRPCFSI